MTVAVRFLKAVLAMAALATVSCSSPAPQTAGERNREEVLLVQQRAHAAVARGDLPAAQSQFENALDRGRAVEDQDTVAIGLLNVAAVLHRSGDLAGSRTRLIELLEHQPPFAREFAGRAEARLALIELQSKRLEESARHAQKAEALCGASCPWRLALENIRAGISLRSGDFASAEARASATRAAAASSSDIREEANSLRILGEIAGDRGQAAQARTALLAALELDRKASIPERVALDLLALARLELALGERKAARDYARRAVDVAEAARLPALLAAARGLLSETQ